MIKYFGIGITDELNLYNHRVTLTALYSAYDDVWEEGVPSYLNHDHRKHLGWVKLDGLYLEPHKAYLTNTLYVGENEDEQLQLKQKSINQLYLKRVEERKDKYNELILKLGDNLSKDYKFSWVNAVSIYDKGIVKRVLPRLCENFDNGLMPLRNLNYVLPGIYEVDGFLIFAHKFFRRGFFYLNTLNEPFLELIHKYKDTCNAKIAIDIDLIGLPSTAKTEFEYQYWWGPKFNNDVVNIPIGVTVYNNEDYDGKLSDILRTEFGWYLQDDIRTFECEEVTDIHNIKSDDIEMYGCRFVHSMISNTTQKPYHLDGAVRSYTTKKMIDRLEVNIKNTGRDTLYHKIWRLDGDLKISEWKELITHYYRDNMLVGEYFDGKDDRLDHKHDKKVTKNKDNNYKLEYYIPTSMESGDGIRLNVSLHETIKIPKQLDVIIESAHGYMQNGTNEKYYDNVTVSFIKMIKSKGIRTSIPSWHRIATEDMVFNLPIFICNNNETASIINNCMRDLCYAWKSHGDNSLISYSVQVNYKNKSVLFSFAGHLNDFLEFFSTTQIRFPSDEDSIDLWLEKIYQFLNKYPSANQSPLIANFKKIDNCLSFQKELVESKYIEEVKSDSKGIRVTLKVKDTEIEVLRKNNIWTAVMYRVIESKCSLCGKEYRLCECNKYFDSNVKEVIEKAEIIGIVWTNRSSLRCENKFNIIS